MQNAKNEQNHRNLELAAAAPGLPRWATRPVTRPALAPMRQGHGPMPYVRVLCSDGAHTDEKMRGWSWEAGWGRSGRFFEVGVFELG